MFEVREFELAPQRVTYVVDTDRNLLLTMCVSGQRFDFDPPMPVAEGQQWLTCWEFKPPRIVLDDGIYQSVETDERASRDHDATRD